MTQRRPRMTTVTCLILLLAAAVNADAQSKPSTRAPFANMNKGRLVIEGGPATPRHDAIYRAILGGRDGKGPLCIIPTATVDPDSAAKAEIAAFGAHGWGGDVVSVPITLERPESARDSAQVNAIQKCSGFFFTGGRQTRVTRVFRPDGGTTPALEAIRARLREGAVVGGTSAGAAIMSDPMLNAGTSVASIARGVASGGISVLPGLGFFSGHLVDQHFFQVNRLGRLLIGVLRLDAYDVGFGVDRNTALVVEGNRAWIAGESAALFVDGRGARRATQGNGGTGLLVHLMGTGDTIDLTSYRLRIPRTKSALAQDGPPITAPQDPFGGWQFLRFLNAMSRSSTSEVTIPAGDYDLVIRKDRTFAAFSFGTAGVQGTLSGLTLGPLQIDINLRGQK